MEHWFPSRGRPAERCNHAFKDILYAGLLLTEMPTPGKSKEELLLMLRLFPYKIGSQKCLRRLGSEVVNSPLKGKWKKNNWFNWENCSKLFYWKTWHLHQIAIFRLLIKWNTGLMKAAECYGILTQHSASTWCCICLRETHGICLGCPRILPEKKSWLYLQNKKHNWKQILS